jgi:cation transport ATPase
MLSIAYTTVDVAFSQGVLLGGGIRTMQALQQATHVVMDKTGTLTEGRLKVVDCHFSQDLRLNKQLCYRLLAAAEVEEARVHPVAKAVFKWALSHAQQEKGSTDVDVVSETRNLVRVLGKGVSCEVRGHSDEWITVHVGHSAFLEENDITLPAVHDFIDTDASVAHFAFGVRYAGRIHVQDTVRQEAYTVVSSLLQEGLEVSMVSIHRWRSLIASTTDIKYQLTGDTATEASRISSTLNIPVLGSRALPTDKMEHIKALQLRDHRVVMV